MSHKSAIIYIVKTDTILPISTISDGAGKIKTGPKQAADAGTMGL